MHMPPWQEQLNKTLAGQDTIFLYEQESATQKSLDLFLLTDLTLYNQQELEQLLSTSRTTKESLILQAYQKWGKDCIHYIKGDFIGVIRDNSKEELFCFRDHLGQVPFYYYLDDDIFIFSNKIQFIASYDKAAEINENWIEVFVTQSSSDNIHTPYTYIKKLPPAHTLTVTKTSASLDKYWNIGNKTQQNITNPGEAIERLRVYMDDAVRVRLNGLNGNNGIELSGGLDSSAIAAIAAKRLKAHISTYSNKLPEIYRGHFEGFDDEYKNIECTRNYLGILNHTYLETVADDPFGYTEKALDAIGYPTYMNINIYQQSIYAQAQKNHVSVLLSGFGGDEVLSANLYNIHVKNLIANAQFQKAVNVIQQKGYSYIKSLRYVLYSYMRKGHIDRRMGSAKQKITNSVLQNTYKSLSYESPVFSKDNYIKEWHAYKLNFPGTAERLETGYHVSGAYGLKYRYPLLDVDTLEYFYHLPDQWKLDHKNGRALFRKAIKDILPAEIVESKKPTNTAVIPVIKIETEKFFGTVKEYLLSSGGQNPIYNYINRDKLTKLTYDEKTAMVAYAMMKRLVMLIMFFDKEKERKRCEFL